MMNLRAILLMLCITCFAGSLQAEKPTYSVESLAGVMRELSKDKYEQPFKTWLAENRPAQYERLFGEKPKEAKTDEPEDTNLFAALIELNAAVADPQIALLDYYINQKAAAGWEVVTVSDRIIIFRQAVTE